MSERSELIHRLRDSIDSRTAYIEAKLGVLVPSQIRALRLRSEMPRQSDLARIAGLHQSRISMFETPGAANVTLETLARLAAAFKVGLVVKFVPISEMLCWETKYSQDDFAVVPIDEDIAFLDPDASTASNLTTTIADLMPRLVSAVAGNNSVQSATGELRTAQGNRQAGFARTSGGR